MTDVSALRIAQITDIHLFAQETTELLGLAPDQSFQALLERLWQVRSHLDLLLLTGDLSQDESPDSYARLQDRLRPLGLPTYWLPGNHDCPATMYQILRQPPLSPDKSWQAGGWQFVLLESRVPGEVGGALTASSLEWLDQQLQRSPQMPALVALHHPPFLVDSAWLDSSTLRNSEDLFAVLDRHPQVKLVMFGHIHQEFSYQRGTVQYLGTPSTCIQFAPRSQSFSLDHEYPGFRYLTLYPDGRWETRVERVVFAHQLNLAATGY